MDSIFSFKDAVHDHLSIGFVRGCIACAQTEADLMLSKQAFHAKAGIPVPAAEARVINFPAQRSLVSGNLSNTA